MHYARCTAGTSAAWRLAGPAAHPGVLSILASIAGLRHPAVAAPGDRRADARGSQLLLRLLLLAPGKEVGRRGRCAARQGASRQGLLCLQCSAPCRMQAAAEAAPLTRRSPCQRHVHDGPRQAICPSSLRSSTAGWVRPRCLPQGAHPRVGKAAAGPALQAVRQGKAGEGAHLAAAPCPLLLLPQLLHPLLAPQPLKALRRGVAQPPHMVACSDPGGGGRHEKGGGWGWCAATTRAGACQRREDACLALAQATRCSGSPAVCREGLHPPPSELNLRQFVNTRRTSSCRSYTLSYARRASFSAARGEAGQQGVGTELRGLLASRLLPDQWQHHGWAARRHEPTPCACSARLSCPLEAAASSRSRLTAAPGVPGGRQQQGSTARRGGHAQRTQHGAQVHGAADLLVVAGGKLLLYWRPKVQLDLRVGQQRAHDGAAGIPGLRGWSGWGGRFRG